MKNVRPVLKLSSKPYIALSMCAAGVYEALKENALLFPDPPVSLGRQRETIEVFNKAIVAWGFVGNRGSQASNRFLREVRKEVEKNLRALRSYVAIVAAGDESLILLAGMSLPASSKRLGMLPAPENLRFQYHKDIKPQQFRLRWNKVKGAVIYTVYMSDSPGGEKKRVGSATKTLCIIDAPELPAHTLRYFWVSAIGAAGESELSDGCAVASWWSA